MAPGVVAPALTSAHDLLQQALNGVFTGSVYALFAVGYTLVFGVLDILNLAHSAVFMLGAVIAFELTTDAGLPLWLAALVAVAACGAIGYTLDRIAFRPLRRRQAPPLNALIGSIGLALVMVSLTQVRFGADSRRFPPDRVPGGVITAGGYVVDDVKIAILAVTLVLMAALGWMIRSTGFGRAMRAVAENPRAALLMGIDVDRVIALTLVLSSALGGIAGVLFAISQNDVSPFIGRDEVELKGLAVIVVGGMGSVAGAVASGYLLGLLEVATLVLIGDNARTAAPFLVLFAVLVVRPRGLFAARLARRV